ncbi:MAG: beta-carotene 15,15'-dioxygenase, Brp/Blh family [Saprospiraceae bacterium]|nr:beta-carotene 15,15'-dioxygenase, Brp/Blh family [Saprospiraceae bacterium]
MPGQIKYLSILTAVIFFTAFPAFSEKYADGLSLILILLFGIPHGAADHIIFSRIGKSFYGARKLNSFILTYLLLGLGFLFIWGISPLKALILFILISIYHFGQEHFESLDPNQWLTKINMFSWGAFVLLFPLLWHSDTTIFFVEQIVSTSIQPLDNTVLLLSLVIIVSAPCVSIFLLWKSGILNTERLISELVQIALLIVLYITTPLLVGFSIYFVFWHSLHAMEDQYIFLRMKTKNYTITRYFRDILPLSIVAIAFVSILGFYLMNQTGYNLFSFVFILIALITLPHILLFEKLYAAKNAQPV